jgi:hypothetical protein
VLNVDPVDNSFSTIIAGPEVFNPNQFQRYPLGSGEITTT